jgi:CBS domain-containing protein
MECTNPGEFKCYCYEHREAFDKLLQLVPMLTQAIPVAPLPPAQAPRAEPSAAVDSLVHNPTVDDLLKAKGEFLITVPPNATLNTAAQMMHQNRIGLLLVRDETQSVVGVLSERDLVKAIATIIDPPFERLTVADLMTTNLITCTPEQTLIYILDVMRMRKFRHMPVLRGSSITAIVSITDILSHLKTNAEIHNEEFMWTTFMNNL